MTNLSDNRVAVGYIVAPQWRVGIGPNSEHFRRTVWITIRRVLSVDTGHIKHYTGAGRSRKTSTHFQEARSRLVLRNDLRPCPVRVVLVSFFGLARRFLS